MDKNEYENIGDYIRRIRNEKGISINELVKQSGVSKGYISQIENNKFSPSLDIVRKLSNALDIDFYDLAWRAGLYTDEEIEERMYKKAEYEAMTPEEEKYLSDQFNHQMLEDFRKEVFPDVKELLKSQTVYFDGKSLSNENKNLAINILNLIFEKLDVDYPTEEEIQKKFDGYQITMDSIQQLATNSNED